MSDTFPSIFPPVKEYAARFKKDVELMVKSGLSVDIRYCNGEAILYIAGWEYPITIIVRKNYPFSPYNVTYLNPDGDTVPIEYTHNPDIYMCQILVKAYSVIQAHHQ
jgi:hypothetical protein